MKAQRSAETLIYTAYEENALDEWRCQFYKKGIAKFSQVDLLRNTFSYYDCEDASPLRDAYVRVASLLTKLLDL
jgi:hypothetical protein